MNDPTEPAGRALRYRLAGPLLVALLAAAAACGGPPEGPEAELPAWVPVYPGGEPLILTQTARGEVRSGVARLTVEAGTEEVLGFYGQAMRDAGFAWSAEPFDGPTGRGGAVTGQSGEGSRGLHVTVSPVEGGTEVILNFSAPR